MATTGRHNMAALPQRLHPHDDSAVDCLSAETKTVQRWNRNAAPLMVIFKKNKLRLFYNHFLPSYYIYTGWKVF